MRIEMRVQKQVRIDNIVFVSRRYDTVDRWIIEFLGDVDGIRRELRLVANRVSPGGSAPLEDWPEVLGYLDDPACDAMDIATRELDLLGSARLADQREQYARYCEDKDDELATSSIQ